MRRNTVIWQGHVQGGSAFCFLSGISRVKCALREFKLRCTGLSIDRPRRDHAFMDGPVTGLIGKVDNGQSHMTCPKRKFHSHYSPKSCSPMDYKRSSQ